MRAEDIDNLEAGRELDVLVAEKVMGWKICNLEDHRGDHEWLDDQANYPYCTSTDSAGDLVVWRTPGHDGYFWRPSLDIAAAWEVVEKLKERFGILAMHYGPDAPLRWLCELRSRDRNDPIEGEAPTAPLAICRAALKAVEQAP